MVQSLLRVKAIASYGLPLCFVSVLCTGCTSDKKNSSADKVGSLSERQMEALPYMGGNPGPVKSDTSGVRTVAQKSAASGLNLFRIPVWGPRAKIIGDAWLVDMNGKRVHRWTSDAGQPARVPGVAPWAGGWDHVELSPDGHLYAIVFDTELLKLDWNSNIVWRAAVPAHHDIALGDDGSVYTIADHLRYVEGMSEKGPILDQEIVKLSAEGVIEKRLSLYDILMADSRGRELVQKEIAERFDAPTKELIAQDAVTRSKSLMLLRAHLGEEVTELDRGVEARTRELLARLVETARDRANTRTLTQTSLSVTHNTFMDLFHTNSIEILAAPAAGIWDKGDYLVSLRHLDLVAVIGARDLLVKWTWGPGELSHQHQPTLLSNGNLLIYDNGRTEKRTRVLEVDPHTKNIVWSYEDKGFFAIGWGGAEELPNGHILITDPFDGRAFEITRSKEIVWEYVAPLIEGNDKVRVLIYRMARYPLDRFGGRLQAQ